MRNLLLGIVFIFSTASFADNEQICSPSAGKTALVVMDMQPLFVTRDGYENLPGNQKKLDLALAEQVKAIEEAKRQKIEIILVEFKAKKHDYGKTNPRLRAAVGNYAQTRTFSKTTDGVFDSDNREKETLVNYLQRKEIGTLVMTGANGGGCVQASMVKALKGNCSVVAYSKAIIDFNDEQFIYPYQGYYPKAKPPCRDCTFKEVATLDKAADAMVGGSNGPRTPVYVTPVREEGSK